MTTQHSTSESMMHYLASPAETSRMTTAELRSHYLVQDLFAPGAISLRFIDLDRVVLGGAIPTKGALRLEAPAAMAAEFFTERRELGVLNVGGEGRVTVDGKAYTMANRDCLYVGRGSRDVTFESANGATPARFYLVSYPAHATFPTSQIARDAADVTELGTVERANRRRLYKYIHPGGIQSAQLVMGMTELLEGSVWNTMPAHTHERRTEVYLYFDLPADSRVFHMMGKPDETRHLVVGDGEVILSPGWSVHSGCGTTNYTFCWAMGGENQVFADMQGVAMEDLR